MRSGSEIPCYPRLGRADDAADADGSTGLYARTTRRSDGARHSRPEGGCKRVAAIGRRLGWARAEEEGEGGEGLGSSAPRLGRQGVPAALCVL